MTDLAAHAFAYTDLRGWLAQAEALGEVRHLSGLSWESEIGMVSTLLQRAAAGPCAVFDNIPGLPPGMRLLTNFFAARRANVTLGFSPGLTRMELSDAFLKVYKDPARVPIPHRIVRDGPVLENTMMGNQVDLEMFPAPQWHPQDGGRYIGTGCYCITRDPDEGWVNCGTYRVMLHARDRVGIYISPGKHGRLHREKYKARGEKMPVCVVLGGNPMQFLLTGNEVPYGVSEFDVLGGLYGKPIDCVQGRLTGLPFPADAEIVLEGFLDPDEMLPEGPLGEWTGYYASGARPEPVMRVEAVHFRNDPIILGCVHELGVSEYARYRAIARSALLKEALSAAGIPDVTGVWAHEVGGARMLVAASIKQRYGGHAMQVGHVLSQCQAGAYAGKFVIVVDDDIDVSDLNELLWATLTRCDPATAMDIIHNAWSSSLDPRIPPEKRERGEFTNSRLIIDACRPFHWRDQFPPVNKPTAEMAREAQRRFGWLLDGREAPPP